MNTSSIVAVLERTPGVLESQLTGLPGSWTSRSSGGASWSARDIVAHLVQGEQEDWVPRARLILEHGEAQSFEAFDREGFRASEADRELDVLLPCFRTLRHANLSWLEQQAFTDSQLELRGTHPAFGSVTLHQLLWAWAAHDLSHQAQVARVLAHQLRDAVGPWREYLPIVQG